MKRRKFIYSSILWSTLPWLSSCFRPNSKLKKELDPFKDKYALFYFSPKGNVFELKEKANLSKLKISPPQKLMPHSFTRSSALKELIAGTEKWGKHVYTIDLVAKKFNVGPMLKENEQYGGHLLFSPDGRHIYAGLNVYGKKAEGFLSVLDTQTLQEVERIPTLGVEPHDMAFLSGKNRLFMLHAGVSLYDKVIEASKIVILDMDKGKVEDTLHTPEKSLHVAHLCKVNENEFFLTGAKLKDPNKATFKNNILCAMVKFDVNKGMTEVEQINKTDIQTEPLLSATHSSKKNILAVTSPGENRVYFWDSQSLKPIKYLDIPLPMCICLNSDQSDFIVGTKKKGLYHINTSRLEISKKIEMPESTFASHSLLLT